MEVKGIDWSLFANKRLETYLLDEKHIPILEELLHDASQNFLRLKKLKKDGALDFGPKIRRKYLPEAFEETCVHVHDFLGIGEIEAPGVIGYFDPLRPSVEDIRTYVSGAASLGFVYSGLAVSGYPDSLVYLNLGIACSFFFLNFLEFSNCDWYHNLNKSIRLSKNSYTSLLPAFGHEYAHHIQNETGVLSSDRSIFSEGHARGVEREISRYFYEENDNEAFTFDISKRNAEEYKGVYLLLCKTFGLTPNKCLLKDTKRVDKNTSHHAKGNALFSIAAAQHGDQIYRDVLHGDFDFEE